MKKNFFINTFNSITNNKTSDEKNTILVSILATSLLELGIICQIIQSKKITLSYVILFILVLVFSTSLNLSLKLYEFILLKRVEFILYIVKDGDTLFSLAEKYLPECNPWKTVELIKERNAISSQIYSGEKLFIPTKKL
ncbi:LysM peptidoglycan-binding domain-containing protein [Clostridium hydrogenum]|uniref:LysM peptidoglycan-binding domain-containing protein n=1 Tax=Clostridium hydrogenum TaxID=2855764 RepID=UPI001F19B522|nr:LysM peptidoglycan-binding domain-containing protein [Clostridium hydrogenum]